MGEGNKIIYTLKGIEYEKPPYEQVPEGAWLGSSRTTREDGTIVVEFYYREETEEDRKRQRELADDNLGSLFVDTAETRDPLPYDYGRTKRSSDSNSERRPGDPPPDMEGGYWTEVGRGTKTRWIFIHDK